MAVLSLVAMAGCDHDATPPDHPRLYPNVALRDVTFYSAALSREMRYRVALPASLPQRKLPAVYLLHGNGGGFRDWSNYSDAAKFAETGLILVMPQGDESYYVNSAERPGNRYEDYIVHDLPADVEARFPPPTAARTARLLGISMGGFGAITLALRHPDLFAFAGDSARPSMCRAAGSRFGGSSSIGPFERSSTLGSDARRRYDPLLRRVTPARPMRRTSF